MHVLAQADPSHTAIAPAADSAVEPATIAFVHRGHDWIRGSEQCLLDLMSRLDPARFRSLLICEQPTLAQAGKDAGVTTMQLDPADDWTILANRAGRPALRARLREVFRAHDVRLVHANVTSLLPVLLPVVRRARLPLVSHIHLSIANEYYRLREFVHQADLVVGVARHVIEPLQEDGVSEGRLRVIYNGIDTDRLGHGDAGELRQALGIPATSFTAVSVGSLIKRKAHDVTLRGIAGARAQGLDTHLVMCGDGEEGEVLRGLVEELGVEPYVHFLGYRTDVGAVIRAVADVFVTSAHEEMMPLNVLEALWLGVPVIASDIPAHREALVDDVTGVIVPEDDAAALAGALVALAAAPERQTALGAAGPDVVAQRFAVQRYVREFEQLYTEVLTRPRSSFGWARGAYWPPLYTQWAVRNLRRRLGLGGGVDPHRPRRFED